MGECARTYGKLESRQHRGDAQSKTKTVRALDVSDRRAFSLGTLKAFFRSLRISGRHARRARRFQAIQQFPSVLHGLAAAANGLHGLRTNPRRSLDQGSTLRSAVIDAHGRILLLDRIAARKSAQAQ